MTVFKIIIPLKIINHTATVLIVIIILYVDHVKYCEIHCTTVYDVCKHK